MSAPVCQETFGYLAHGERIASQIRLPEYFEAADDLGPLPLCIETGPLTHPLPGEHGTTELPGGSLRLWWQTSGDFTVSAEGNISGQQPAGASDALFRLPMLGTVLSVALARRRRFVLHGNAVCVNGRGLIIVGYKGQGKTTLTACLLRRGHRLIADDVSVITQDRSEAFVHRGALQLRLWPDAIEQTFAEPAEHFEQISDTYPKRIVPAHQFGIDRENVPLTAVLNVCESDEISLTPLPTAEAWKQAVIHSFQSRLGSAFLRGESGGWHHGQCARLVRAVKFYRLDRPRDFARLGDVARLIETAFV